ncbi:heme exporter protein CcmD [Thalassotalea atypica]|uniref:heme exporter protein CcmD n=1 Tax=Thalassotalea atypica TaxID=2054316 RepID=UPI002573A84A|nr:heme exporter protein CcmD [Thalassotalea atypica]
MQFDSFSDFINMGGYAFYVWFAFGVSGALLVLLTLTTKYNHKKIKADIIQQIKREQKLKQAAKIHKQSQEVANES